MRGLAMRVANVYVAAISIANAKMIEASRNALDECLIATQNRQNPGRFFNQPSALGYSSGNNTAT